jgi:hypothetical protein
MIEISNTSISYIFYINVVLAEKRKYFVIMIYYACALDNSDCESLEKRNREKR